MRIVIVGAGAIGTLFGAFLSRGGHEVIFVEIRPEVVEAINLQGISLMELGVDNPDQMENIPARAVANAAELHECDGVLLAVKSFDTLAAMKSVAHLITQSSPVLSLQTALGNLEVMEKVERRKNIIGGFTFMSSTALGPGRVRHGGAGKTYIGELNGKRTPRLEKLARALNDCGIECEMVGRIMGRLWCKVIVFSALNTVSSVLRVKNGRLLDKMDSITLMKRLIDEGRAVAEAHSVDLVYHDLYDLLFDSCQRSAHNISSMLQDILGGRPTEIDALNGAIVRYGEERGIPATTHRTMIEIIKLLEKWGHGLEY